MLGFRSYIQYEAAAKAPPAFSGTLSPTYKSFLKFSQWHCCSIRHTLPSRHRLWYWRPHIGGGKSQNGRDDEMEMLRIMLNLLFCSGWVERAHGQADNGTPNDTFRCPRESTHLSSPGSFRCLWAFDHAELDQREGAALWWTAFGGELH
jgi:hypothetical protein